MLLPPEQLRDLLHKPELSQRSRLHLILAAAGDSPMPVSEVERVATEAGLHEVGKWNISDALNKSKGLASRLPKGWVLTSAGKAQVEKEFGVTLRSQAPAPVLHKLRNALLAVQNNDTQTYVEEAVRCYEAGLFRASVVLSWMGAVSLLQDYILQHKLTAFNAEAKRRNAKWKPISNKDGFGRMDEAEFLDLLADPALGVLGKNVKEELKNNCLQLRNGCGHPNSLKIADHRVASHLEVLILNVFSKF